MENGSISEQLELQNQKSTDENKKNILQYNGKNINISCNFNSKQNSEWSFNRGNNTGGDSLLSIFSLGDDNNYNATQAEELQAKKLKKKKKKGIRR